MVDPKNAKDEIELESQAYGCSLATSDRNFGKYLPIPIKRLWAGIGFLTKVPVPTWIAADTESLSSSRPYFPAVGVIIGLGLALFDRLFTILFPLPAACALDLVLMFLITGGLHWDGVIDTFDGILGAHTREDALRIMRDSRIGALGATTMVILLITKYGLLLSIPFVRLETARLISCPRFQALMVSPVLARWSMCLVMHAFPYARKEGGIGSLFIRGPRREETCTEKLGSILTNLILPGAFTLFCAVAISGKRGAFAFLICTLFSYLGGCKTSRFLNGLTGDTYGAVCEISEIVALAAFCVHI